MNRQKQYPRSGGVLLAGAVIAGVIGGIVAREPSLGFLIGLGTGLALLGLVYLSDRRRRD